MYLTDLSLFFPLKIITCLTFCHSKGKNIFFGLYYSLLEPCQLKKQYSEGEKNTWGG